MEVMYRFKEGDKVLLQMGVDVKYAPQGLKRWDGCQFIIDKIYYRKNTHLYELKSCRSIHGMPYTICEEWIVPIE